MSGGAFQSDPEHGVPAPHGPNERRAFERIDVGGLVCAQGTVVDISLSGIKLLVPEEQWGDELTFVHLFDEQDRAVLSVVVMWTERHHSPGRVLVGAAFVAQSFRMTQRLLGMIERNADVP